MSQSAVIRYHQERDKRRFDHLWNVLEGRASSLDDPSPKPLLDDQHHIPQPLVRIIWEYATMPWPAIYVYVEQAETVRISRWVPTQLNSLAPATMGRHDSLAAAVSHFATTLKANKRNSVNGQLVASTWKGEVQSINVEEIASGARCVLVPFNGSLLLVENARPEDHTPMRFYYVSADSGASHRRG
jgi:hypothetical protein